MNELSQPFASDAAATPASETTPSANPIAFYERALLFGGYSLLICLRMPDIILKGRFWAEEGVFFHNAWTLPWYEALLTPTLGYLCLIATSAGLLARYAVPLEFAPYITISIALLFQLCPALLLLTSQETWLQRRASLALALLLFITPPISEEVWLNTLHSQFHLTLCTALILAFEPTKGKVEWFRRTLLLLGGLSGPGAAFLLPLFILRSIHDRSRARAVQACVLGLGVMVQLGLFYSTVPQRSYGIGFLLLLSVVFVRHLVVPFLGRQQSLDIASGIQTSVESGQMPLWPSLITVAVLGLLVFALLLRRRADLMWLFLAGCTILVLTYYGALDGRANLLLVDFGHRYYYVQQAIFALVVLGLAATGSDLLSKISWLVAFWMAVIGMREYFWPSASIFAHGPDWRAEVAHWRRDPSYPIRLWPGLPEGKWTVQLPIAGKGATLR